MTCLSFSQVNPFEEIWEAIKSLYLQQTEEPNVILQAFPIYKRQKGYAREEECVILALWRIKCINFWWKRNIYPVSCKPLIQIHSISHCITFNLWHILLFLKLVLICFRRLGLAIKSFEICHLKLNNFTGEALFSTTYSTLIVFKGLCISD